MSEIVTEEGRVTGIRGRTPGGNTVVEKARIVIGADGNHSSVAVAADASRYNTRPSTAQGITDAFRDADLLCEALDEGFSGRRELKDSLADYQRRRDAADAGTVLMAEFFAPGNLARIVQARPGASAGGA